MTIIDTTSKINKLINSKKILVFDFDGVIADSVEIKTQAFASLYEKYGNDVVSKVIKHHKNNGGVSRFEKIRKYHSEFLGLPITESKLDELCNEFSELVIDKVVAANEIPGVREFIEKKCSGETICVINSATPTIEISSIIDKKQLSPFFDAIYGSPASKKVNLESLLSKFQLSANNGVFFGDAKSDFEASKSLKMDFVYIGEVCDKPFSENDLLIYNAVNFLGLNKRCSIVR